MKKLFSIILLASITSWVLAQGSLKNLSTDIFFGTPIFYGDIPNKIGYTFSTKLNWHLTSAISINTNFSFGKLKGFDKKNKSYFNNNFSKMMFGGEIYFFNIFQISQISNFIQPFGGINIGGIKSNIVSAGTYKTESTKFYKNWTFAYEYVGGIKFKLNNFIDINAKTVIVLTKSDKLDNYQPNVPANRNNDAYSEYVLGISIHFLKKNKTPIIWDSNKNSILFFKNNKEDDNEIEYINIYSIETRIKELQAKKHELSKTSSSKDKDSKLEEIIEDDENSIFKCARKY